MRKKACKLVNRKGQNRLLKVLFKNKWPNEYFLQSLDIELKKLKSSVNVTWICPYAIDTGMFAGFESRQAWIVDVLKGTNFIYMTGLPKGQLIYSI